MTKLLLRLEGLVVFSCCLFFYNYFDGNWFLFIILLFSPDIAALGYLINNKTGTILYNLFHTYIFPLALLIIGFIFAFFSLIIVALIWIAHIGMDRIFGFGLKYEGSFQKTHFERL